MAVRFLLALVVWIPLIAQAETANESPSPLRVEALDSSDLAGNLKKLEQYYARVNQQMDKRLSRNARDPFADTEQTRQPSAPSLQKKDLFVPKRLSGNTTEDTKSSGKFSLSQAQQEESQGIPRMQFRGFIRMDGEKAGLLNINGLGTFVVKEGDKVGLQQMTSDTVVRIVEINPLNLIIEFGNLGEKVVIQ
ncbi:hypothetical protein [Pontibacterium sp.]|uniref:hypothetical protein n=1 Tax=Pontibacterium sp. TaxID=2036026 RepID=UPI003567416F